MFVCQIEGEVNSGTSVSTLKIALIVINQCRGVHRKTMIPDAVHYVVRYRLHYLVRYRLGFAPYLRICLVRLLMVGCAATKLLTVDIRDVAWVQSIMHDVID